MNKTPSIAVLKKELSYRSEQEIIDFCVTLIKFNRENKELLNYLLIDEVEKEVFLNEIKITISANFLDINFRSYHILRKSVRKILKLTKKYIKLINEPIKELTLLIHFNQELITCLPKLKNYPSIENYFISNIKKMESIVAKLHPDLHYDYINDINELKIKL